LNELDVIRKLSSNLPDAPEEVIVGIGDDCAVIRLGDRDWVAAADMLVSGHHFEMAWSTPEDVGYKAVAVNVSDVAAMGATPRFILVSGGADDSETTLRCMEGVMQACAEFDVFPLGGDTTRAAALTIDVAILGELTAPPVLRSGARPGDLLAVTGELGASAAGLLALQNDHREPERLIQKHLRPEPRTAAGRIAARLRVSAMLDLSDGLATDAKRICEASGVGCRVELEKLPISEDTREICARFDRDAKELAATGGEDYELLISAPEDVVTALSEGLEFPLTVIGSVIEGEGAIFLRNGNPVQNLSGWDHFS
jgi:thiamine-monophosphate kinase